MLATPEISFGPFRLLPSQHLLLEDDKPVALGSRAMDILLALVERPGELVTKEELMARVWPNVFVDPANLAVHISALRRALQDRCNGNRFIINIPGRGYRFVAAISQGELSEPSSAKSELIQKPRGGNSPANIAHLETRGMPFKGAPYHRSRGTFFSSFSNVRRAYSR
jgi:DNA-binding winged helix-turn-helix (wHTH) protein